MPEKIYKVYKATNLINQKCYIGITQQLLKDRKRDHLKKSFILNSQTYFHNALRKYGKENFKWEIIDTSASSYDELNLLEQLYIEEYKLKGFNLYNLTDGGGGISGHTFKTTRSYPKGETHPNYKRVERVCPICGKKDLVTPWYFEHHKYCSRTCSHKSRAKPKIEKVKIKLEGKDHPLYKERIPSICEHCGKSFIKSSQFQIDKSRYCSRECADKAKLGSSWGKHSEETKKIMSEKASGENNPMYGKVSNENQKKALSIQKGITHHKATMTLSQIQEIRLLSDCLGLSLSQIGKIYNITKDKVHKIVTYKTWKEA